MKFEKTPMDNNHKPENIKTEMSAVENTTMHYFNLMHESDMARLSRTNELLMKANKRVHIQNAIQIIVILAMVIAFFIYESQYVGVSETTTEEYTASVDGNGVALTNGSGELNYGGTGNLQKDQNDNIS